MTEIRTTSSTGGQKGVKPERFSLIPRRGLEAIARVFGFGAEKYDAHNWRRGYEWSKSFDALERHTQAAKDGETYDPESGLPHLAHAGFHILVLLTWLYEQGEGIDNDFDDRWPVAMERARLAEVAKAAFDPQLDTSTPLDGWEEVGSVDEDARIAPFAMEDIKDLQEQINRTVRNMLDAQRLPDYYRPPVVVHHTTGWVPPQEAPFINDAHNGPAARG